MTDNSIYVGLREIVEELAALTKATERVADHAREATHLMEQSRLELKRSRMAIETLAREARTK